MKMKLRETSQVKMPTAENTPSLCTNGAAYVGGNIISHGDYLAVVNPDDTSQKTLIRQGSVETNSVATQSIDTMDLSVSNLHAREVTTDHIMSTEGANITLYGNPTVTGTLTTDKTVAVSMECMGVYCSTVNTNSIVTDGGFIYIANKTNFGDTLQGTALNRDTATEVLKFYPNVYLTGTTSAFKVLPIIFHRVTEYLLYVGIKGEYTMKFNDTLADRINSESMGCTKIAFTAADGGKSYPTNLYNSNSECALHYQSNCRQWNGEQLPC